MKNNYKLVKGLGNIKGNISYIEKNGRTMSMNELVNELNDYYMITKLCSKAMFHGENDEIRTVIDKICEIIKK